jgi:transglutaminase-like putative cysteine protease
MQYFNNISTTLKWGCPDFHNLALVFFGFAFSTKRLFELEYQAPKARRIGHCSPNSAISAVRIATPQPHVCREIVCVFIKLAQSKDLSIGSSIFRYMIRRNMSLYIMILVSMLVATSFSGCISFDLYGVGNAFNISDLTVPVVPSYDPNEPLSVPEATQSSQPSYIYKMRWEVGEVYADYGGVVSISIDNTGPNDIFVYRYGLSWLDTDISIFKNVSVRINASEEKNLGLLFFTAPLTAGNHSYKLSISLLINHNLHKEIFGDRWYDAGSKESKVSYIDVKPIGEGSDYSTKYNPHIYYDKVNELIEPTDSLVHNESFNLAREYPGDYNIYQVCAVFDFLINEITYKEEERDVWASPHQTLITKEGDCEDHSLLFASMVTAIGGTARIYLIENHAFSAVYIGNTSIEVENITSAIKKYYSGDFQFHYLKDELGYWLIADTLGSFYLGGLPVNSAPTGYSSEEWQWDFTDTSILIKVDVTGKPLSLLWIFQGINWIVIFLCLGIVAVILLIIIKRRKTAYALPICMICHNPILEEYVICECGAAYHKNCAEKTNRKCLKCGMPLPSF